MAVAGIGRRLKLRWFGAGRVFDLLGGCRRCARAENAGSRQCRKSPQYAAAIPADPLDRLLPSARCPHLPIRVGFETKMALLGFLGNSLSAGAGKCDRWWRPAQRQARRRSPDSNMFGHAGGRASPGKAATAARSRQGSPERARHSYTSLPRLTDAQLEASGTGMSALYCQRRIGHQRLSKRAKRGFRGYPIATVALYGPDDRAATKLMVASFRRSMPRPQILSAGSSKGPISAMTAALRKEVLAFIDAAGAKSTVMTDRIIGCAHDEGIDYQGRTCPSCSSTGQ